MTTKTGQDDIRAGWRTTARLGILAAALAAGPGAAQQWKPQKNAWTEDFRGSVETRKHLDAESELLRKILVELGVLKR